MACCYIQFILIFKYEGKHFFFAYILTSIYFIYQIFRKNMVYLYIKPKTITIFTALTWAHHIWFYFVILLLYFVFHVLYNTNVYIRETVYFKSALTMNDCKSIYLWKNWFYSAFTQENFTFYPSIIDGRTQIFHLLSQENVHDCRKMTKINAFVKVVCICTVRTCCTEMR